MAKKVTAIKVQKKNPERVNVYLDGEFAFGLARITAAWLKTGQELAEEKINELLARDEIEVAYQRALRYLSFRPRTKSEIEEKLKDLDYQTQVIETVIDRLLEKRYINDQQFAELWVENRSTFKPRSHRLLAWELRKKQVQPEIIEDVLSQAQSNEELARAAAEKYISRLAGKDFETFQKRLFGFLSRRGFSYGIVSETVREMWSRMQYEQE